MKREMNAAKLELEPPELSEEEIKKRLETKAERGLRSKIGKMMPGALIEQDEDWATYFLLEGDVINGRGWGVTKSSIPHNIQTFKGMPYTITSDVFIENSVYGSIYDHPSLEHLVPLGLALPGTVDLNDLNRIIKFQKEFKVGTMMDIFHASLDDSWRVIIKKSPEFRGRELPLFVSPAVWKLDDDEPDEAMTKWRGLHLTGLDARPAYGNQAIKKAECVGTALKCHSSLRVASMVEKMASCHFKEIIQGMQLQSAKMAVLTSPDISQTQVQNVFGCKKKDPQGNCLSAKAQMGLDEGEISDQTRKFLVDCERRDTTGNCIQTGKSKRY